MATLLDSNQAILNSSEEDPLYEVVGGQRLELLPMGAYPTQIASTLLFFLTQFVREHQLGRVNAEMLYRLNEVNRLERRPDVAFVSYDRWPRDRPVPDEAAWPVVPDLAVEVLSPTDRMEDVLEKIAQYFDAGVRTVWVVSPRCRIVYTFEAIDQVQAVTKGSELSGGTLLPEFRVSLPALFDDPPATTPVNPPRSN